MTIALPVFPDNGLLTHSSVQTWKVCPRKYFYRYRLGVRTPPGEALRIGTAFHLGCELWGQPDMAQRLANLYYLQEDFEWAQLEMAIVSAMVLAWGQRYQGDQVIKILAREISFELPIINPSTGRQNATYRQAGKIDAIGELPDGRICLVERKTIGESLEPGSDYWKRLFLDSQISRYVLAARALGYPVETVAYDVVRKPLIRPKNISKAEATRAVADGRYFDYKITGPLPERETPVLFAARLHADMTARPEFYFARKEIARLETDLLEYQQEQWLVARQLRDAELYERDFGTAAWPRNTGACVNPYRCEYLDICRGLAADPLQELPDGFVRADVLHPELSSTTGEKNVSQNTNAVARAVNTIDDAPPD